MKLYIPVWTIKDPEEMLIAISQLRESDLDFTLLTKETIGIRPSCLFKAIKIFKDKSWDPNRTLYSETGRPDFGISMKFLDIQGDAYWAVYYVLGFGTITAITDDHGGNDLEIWILPFDGVKGNSQKEEMLRKYADFLGFKIS
jgi:hypothetical protein